MAPETHPQLLAGRRIPVRDRAHAYDIASNVASSACFEAGGTIDGFANWLFVQRETFNGTNPTQQLSVYANAYRAASKRGIDFDLLCRTRADEKERLRDQAKATIDGNAAAIKAVLTGSPEGPGIVLAIAELCLGRASRFTDSPGGAALPNPPPTTVAGVLQVLVNIGGRDDQLHRFEWISASAVNELSRTAPTRDLQLMRIRAGIFQGCNPSDDSTACIAYVAMLLSRIPSVRIMLRSLLVEVQMAERIGDAAAGLADGRTARVRLHRRI